ncbi:uncharacterized protein [Miscanthus floridulus]|uniref:uncharacterized protein n=1 Tax=Miscanthus floridulus TaxID=154761 RepID=UPI0034574FFA
MDRRPPLAVSPRRLRPRPHRVPRPPLAPASSVQTPPGSMKKAAAAPMSASVCAIPSPVRFEPSPMRASISALPSPIRAEPSPMRASMTSALQPPRRVKLDLTAATRAAAAEKENFFPAAAPPSPPQAARARAGFEKENLLPPGADAHDELVALNLAAITAGTPAGGPLFVRGRLYDVYSARRDERLKRKQGFPYYCEEFAPAASVDPEVIAEDPCVAVELSKRRVAKKAYTASGAESVRRSAPAVDFAAGHGGGLGLRSSLRSSKEMKKPSAASGAVSVAIKERRVTPRSSARRF